MSEIQQEFDQMRLNSMLIREFDPQKDIQRVDELERRCEVGPSRSVSLFTDLLGDPICRIRYTPSYIMLVAEYGLQGEIVGIIRGSIKTVVCGVKQLEWEETPIYTKAAYMLGLRVSPTHRRKGIGLRLVQALEAWFKANGAEYAYMATEKDNEGCIKLFVDKCSYTKFRTPAILVHPVYAHSKRISSAINILKLDFREAEKLYRKCMGTSEFFPQDIDVVLRNKLSLGTWVAFPRAETWPSAASWAVLSVWSSNDIFKMQVKGVRKTTLIYAAASRLLDKAFPWLKIPSIPDIFRPFGFHFLYGLYAEGPQSGKLMSELWWFVHNLARKKKGCRVIAAEVGGCDPLKNWIPHWNSLSCPEDLWCIKNLGFCDNDEGERAVDWSTCSPGKSLFVDPREF